MNKNVLSSAIALMTVVGATSVTPMMRLQPVYAQSQRTPVADEGDFGDHATYKISKDGTLTISGTGSIGDSRDEDFDGVTDSLFLNNTIYKIIIENGITEIGPGAFKNLNGVTNISLPDSLQTISSEAFNGCAQLQSINIPDSVTTIGSYAFANCSKLTSVKLPSQLDAISYGMFANDSSLYLVTLPNTVQKIGDSVFYECRHLSSINILDHLTEIGESAFEYCTSLNNVSLPSTLQTIKAFAFHNCESLSSINLPANVTVVERAFLGCLSLSNVKFEGDYSNDYQSMFQDFIDTLNTSHKKLTVQYPALAKNWGPYAQYYDCFNYGNYSFSNDEQFNDLISKVLEFKPYSENAGDLTVRNNVNDFMQSVHKLYRGDYQLYEYDDEFTEGVRDFDEQLNNEQSTYDSFGSQGEGLVSQKALNELKEMQAKRDQLMKLAPPSEMSQDDTEDNNDIDDEDTASNTSIAPVQADTSTSTKTTTRQATSQNTKAHTATSQALNTTVNTSGPASTPSNSKGTVGNKQAATMSNTKASASVKTIHITGKTKILKANKLKGKIKWSSNNKKIATVSKGKVTFKKKGTIIITASSGHQTQKFKVVYKGAKDKVHTFSIAMKKGITKSLKLKNASKIKWASKNKKVAVISKGKIKAKAKGKTTITVSFKKQTQKYKVTVK